MVKAFNFSCLLYTCL